MNGILGNFLFSLQEYLYIIPMALIALSFHEVSHAFVSYLQGDPTPKDAGRLTLNPLASFDLWGALCMVFFRFGWAKPVPINPAWYKNKKRGIVLTSLAGPCSNILLALLFMILWKLYIVYAWSHIGGMWVLRLMEMGIVLNCSLAVFNLLPISPLDGSKVLYALLPTRIYYKILQYERYGMIVLILLMYFTNILDVPIAMGVNGIVTLLDKITHFIG
ncbi:MAG: site-2 protease family protein [Clostridia bacterium]|nr:site-2 protease family protein [Clostridia bacterium]